ncbi:MAG: diaminopimelate epimerase, partial [Actinomycetota bacterium]
MRFAKYHGAGNDFVMVEDMEDALRLPSSLIAALCDRHRGIGADGLIRIAPHDEADFFMDYYNADGEVSEMCGNGVRCLGKYVYDRGLTSSTEVQVLTRAGTKTLQIDAENGMARAVTVDIGAPALERKAIPMTGEPADTFVGQPFEVEGREYSATAVSMGNPHIVLFVDGASELADLEVSRVGPIVEHRPEFPNRTN